MQTESGWTRTRKHRDAALIGLLALMTAGATASSSGTPLESAAMPAATTVAAPVAVPALTAAAAPDAAEGTLGAVPVPARLGEGETVVLYYCHQTYRCETCLMAERLIEDLLRTDFAVQFEQARLRWQPLDYEQPENAAYAQAFALEGGPALVFGRWRAGQLVEWHDVPEIWDHSEDQTALVESARERLTLFLQAEKWRAANDSVHAVSGAPAIAPGAGPDASTGTPHNR